MGAATVAEVNGKSNMTFARFKKQILPLKPKLFSLRWYPSRRSCVHPGSRTISPQQMPPLMVRKAEWRR